MPFTEKMEEAASGEKLFETGQFAHTTRARSSQTVCVCVVVHSLSGSP